MDLVGQAASACLCRIYSLGELLGILLTFFHHFNRKLKSNDTFFGRNEHAISTVLSCISIF
jgi:hypothetical protein